MSDTSKVLDVAAKAGHILLENGAEISRVEDTMERIATHYGAADENFFVLSNGIFTTGDTYSKVEFIPIRASRLDKVVEVNQLSREISEGGVTVEEADRRLDRINSSPDKSIWEQLAGTALGSAGFCAIFGGGYADCLASLLCGVLMYAFVILIGSKYLTKPVTNICGSMLGTALCMLLFSLGLGHSLGNMVIGTLIPLIPGVAFTNGLRDIAGEDYLAGTIRLLDATMVFFCIAVGVCLSFFIMDRLLGGTIRIDGLTADPDTYRFPVQTAAAFMGTAAFAVLFGVPRKHYFTTGLVGMIGWIVYMLVVRYTTLTVIGGTFIASLCVAILSQYCAVRKKCISTVFLICGIFPMIPGAGVFWSTLYIVKQQFASAIQSGFMAVEITFAIVLSIIIETNVREWISRRRLHGKA